MKRLALLALAGFIAPAVAQDAVTSITSTEVAPGIHILEGADGFAGGNMTLLTGDEQVVLIDPQIQARQDGGPFSVAHGAALD